MRDGKREVSGHCSTWAILCLIRGSGARTPPPQSVRPLEGWGDTLQHFPSSIALLPTALIPLSLLCADVSSEYLSTVEQTDTEDQPAKVQKAPGGLTGLTPIYIVKNVILKQVGPSPCHQPLPPSMPSGQVLFPTRLEP